MSRIILISFTMIFLLSAQAEANSVCCNGNKWYYCCSGWSSTTVKISSSWYGAKCSTLIDGPYSDAYNCVGNPAGESGCNATCKQS